MAGVTRHASLALVLFLVLPFFVSVVCVESRDKKKENKDGTGT